MEISLLILSAFMFVPPVIYWLFFIKRSKPVSYGTNLAYSPQRNKKWEAKNGGSHFSPNDEDSSTKNELQAENDDSCFLPNEDSSTSDLEVEKFRKELLLGHNYYRQLHGSPPLSFLQKLNDAAQQWADYIANKGYLQYADCLYNTGESIAVIDLAIDNMNGKVLSMQWYKEIKNYSFTEPRWRRGAFHFTQMMWHSTTHLGAGLCRVPDYPEMVFVVVRYFPAGNSNMPGEFHRNVLPRISLPKGSRSSWNMEDDVVTYRNSVSGKLRRSCVSSSVMDEAFV